MTTFYLSYNPFTKEKTFQVDGENDDLEQCWGSESKELSEWVGCFYEKLYKKYNDSEMEVKFKGILRDYEFLEDAKIAYEKENPSVKISLKGRDDCTSSNEKLGELKKLFEKMQKETPFETLKGKDVEDLFNQAVSSEFEMAVVATMSSGKSTLINAMLGRELLPARNEATTATLAKIYDEDGAEYFKGKSYDKDHNELDSRDPLKLSDMNALNDNPQTSLIEIYGDILGIASKDLRLVLTDTPGPNNSRTDEHKQHTYSLLTADYKPMILYVLNGTQLETKDDDSLLHDVAEAMKSGGRQAQERFIFILNKADEFDPGKGEDLSKKIQDVKDYLKRHGILNARVFPTAARMAKVIRQYQNNQPLTETEEDDILPKYSSFIKREWKHFSNFAPLSPMMKKKQEAMIASAKGKDDLYQEALIYTGVPAIELAMSEYLEKYALPAKITEGVYSFKDKIENLNIEANEEEKLKNNKDKVNELAESISIILKKLENGEKAELVRKQIDDVSVQDVLKQNFESATSGFMSEYISQTKEMRKVKMNLSDADRCAKNLGNTLFDLGAKFRVQVQNALNSIMKVQVKKAVDNYAKYLKDLIGSGSYNLPPEAILGDVACITVESTLNNYKRTERVKVGSHLEKESGIWGGIKRFFTFGSCGYKTVNDYENRDYIDFSAYLENEVYPQIENFVASTRQTAFTWATEEETRFKNFFKNELGKLENAIKQKLSEKEKCLKDKEKFEKMLQKNKENIKWLKQFKTDLDHVLVI